MRYEGSVFRPPSEAYSLIVQVTIGCSHNKCTFCSMYKDKQFRVRSIKEVIEDLRKARSYYERVERVFLADGNALVLKNEDLKTILSAVKEIFPECKRIGVYASAMDILRKTKDELIELNKLGLGIVYMGVESGSDEILKEINKGCIASEIIEAGKKLKNTGIKLSLTLISGIGGKEKSSIHAIESAKLVSEINPEYVGLLTLMVESGTEMERKIKDGELKLLTPKEVMVETREFLSNLQVTNCIFRSNHASNYAPLSAVLNEEKEILIKEIDSMLNEDFNFKNEKFRRL